LTRNMKNFEKALAVGLSAAALVGCGSEQKGQPTNQKPQQPEASAAASQGQQAEKSPQGRHMPMAMAKHLVSGCDLNKARTEIYQSVVQHKHFTAYTMDGSTTKKHPYTVAFDNKITILNPFFLQCKGQVVAFVGISTPENSKTSLTEASVEMITNDEPTVFIGLPRQKFTGEAADLHYNGPDRSKMHPKGYEATVMANFAGTKKNQHYGSVINDVAPELASNIPVYQLGGAESQAGPTA
jgi:hypothetical protein